MFTRSILGVYKVVYGIYKQSQNKLLVNEHMATTPHLILNITEYYKRLHRISMLHVKLYLCRFSTFFS